jgi:hypothetical protein
MKVTKPIIETAPNAYGFGHDWTLVTRHGSFYLGQDSKFCSRVLGMRGSDVAHAIGSNDLTQPPVRRKLAAFILQSMGLDETNLQDIQPWELCCQ